MRIIAEKRIRKYARKYADARLPLMAFTRVVKQAAWRDLQDLRKTYPHADAVSVTSGRIATVFNIKGTHYRLITAVHYNTGRTFVLRFLTHAEYSKGSWKEHR